MIYSTKISKFEAEKNFVGIINVRNFEVANPEITCSTFLYSSLFVPWLLTLAGIPSVCAKLKPSHCGRQQKMKKETYVSFEKSIEGFGRN